MAKTYCERWINVRGIKTRYLTAGEGKPVILLHGGGAGVSAIDNWHHSIGPIADAGFSVYAPEMVGFGLTDKPESGNTVEAKVRHVKDFIDLLCLDKVGLIGNSLGGRVALGIALDWRTRVRRLVLTGSAGMRLEPSPMLKQLISYTPSKQKMRRLVEALFHDPSLVTDQMIESRYQLSLLPGAQEAFEGFFKAASDPKHRGAMDIEDKLPQIQTPALLIWGKQDRAIPVEVGKWMAELLPNARLKVLDNCGHWTQLEQTQKFNQLVINFITGNQPEGLSR